MNRKIFHGNNTDKGRYLTSCPVHLGMVASGCCRCCEFNIEHEKKYVVCSNPDQTLGEIIK